MQDNAAHHVFPMVSPWPKVVGGLIISACTAFLFITFSITGEVVLDHALGLGSLGFFVLGLISTFNLAAHEGWAVVVGDNELQLPNALYRSRKRVRVQYSSIEFVGLGPMPTGQPDTVMIHLRDGMGVRWIKQQDLLDGDVKHVAELLCRRLIDYYGEINRGS